MTFTNTKSVGKNWSTYKVISQVDDQMNFQLYFKVNFQVKWQVDEQINPIKYKTKEDLIKFHKTIV